MHLQNILPAQGQYSVSLTLHTDMGASRGVSKPVNRIVRIRDYLIVSMGDSLASGEGNPDVPGSYNLHYNFKGEATVTKVNRPVRWQDRRCHRSAKSGPSLAAKAFENRYTSVTFLSVACSGAEIRHLINSRYGGIEPVGTSTVPPQVDAVGALVGPGSPRGGRPIDAVLISIGVNDLSFGDIIHRCAKNWNHATGHTQCVTEGGIATALASLPDKYRALAEVLHAKLPATREVYLNDYPANVFRGGACGSLAFTGFGIDAAEAEEINTWGIALGWKITEATRTFRDDYDHWNLVDDLSGPFDPHAYCAGESWFTRYEQSMQTQGNEKGTAHPNAAGHIAYAHLLRQAMAPEQGRRPYRHLTIAIKAIKAAATSGGQDRQVNLTLYQYQRDYYGLTRYMQVPRNGQWTPVPPALGTFTLDVFPVPASPRHATGLYMDFAHILGIHGTRSNGYDVGSHVSVHPTGSLAVSYSVTAETPPTGPVNGQLQGK